MSKSNRRTHRLIKKVICIVICLVIAFFGIVTLGNHIFVRFLEKDNQKLEKVQTKGIKPEYIDGVYTFTTDEEFTVLQLTDIHLGGGIGTVNMDKYALESVRTMLYYTKPDLVILTGDLAFAIPNALNLDSIHIYRLFGEMMDTLGVYWTISFGNHDSEWFNFIDREYLSDYIISKNFKYCLFTNNDGEVFGCGNQFINVKNTNGIITQTFVLIDSNDYYQKITDRSYDIIHDDQVAWYKAGIQKFQAQNDAIVEENDIKDYNGHSSLVFFHIPLEEYKFAYQEFKDNSYQDTENVQYLYGEINEPICCSQNDSEMFEAILELGSTKAVFVGHDHTNNIALNYKGITLAYSYSIDNFAYENLQNSDFCRGGTLITVKNDCSVNYKLLHLNDCK